MAKNPRDDQPKEPAKDFFERFRFSPQRGLYVPKSEIDGKGIRSSNKTSREKKSRYGVLKWLTFWLLVLNAYIFWRQAGIMDAQRNITEHTLPAMQAQASAAVEAAHRRAGNAPWAELKQVEQAQAPVRDSGCPPIEFRESDSFG